MQKTKELSRQHLSTDLDQQNLSELRLAYFYLRNFGAFCRKRLVAGGMSMYSEQPQSMQEPELPVEMHVADVDEMAATVDPWNLEMTQLDAGRFSGHFRVGNIDGVLVSIERWSHRVLASGGTPPGYFTVCAPDPARVLLWGGEEASRNELIWGLGNSDIEFLTSKDETHKVLLFPEETIETAAGCALEDMVPSRHGATAIRSQEADRLWKLVNVCLREDFDSLLSARHTQLKQDLLSMVVGSLFQSDEPGRRHSIRKSRLTCSRATRLAVSSADPPAVTELAVQTGVSLRVLELAFKETLGISPLQFLNRLRLQRLRASLRESSPDDTTVTALMQKQGFAELGRTAVRFKEVFGESPSQTLEDLPKGREKRFCDLLQAA